MQLQNIAGLDGSQETVRRLSKPSSIRALRYDPPAECDIERLLQWAYGRQEVHRRLREAQRDGPVSAGGGGRDSVVKVQMNAIHGGRISGGGLPPGLPPETLMVDDIHPAAVTLHNRVLYLFGGTPANCFQDADNLSIGLLIKHGYEASRPDWGGPFQPIEAKRNRKGQVVMFRDENCHGLACQLDRETVVYNQSLHHMREMYLHWYLALLMLRGDLVDEGLLPDLTIHRPFALSMPWRAPAQQAA